MNIVFLILIGSMLCQACQTTVDINNRELKYLAGHLSPEECRRLIASLHLNTSYELPPESDILVAASHLSQEAPCLELLQKWNNDSGDGTTHTLVTRRLIQLQRDDLASWLSQTVFQDIAKEVEHAILEDGVITDTPDSDQNNKEPYWTESTIIDVEDADTDDDDVYFDDVDVDDTSSATWAMIMTGAIVFILFGCYQIVQMVLRKREQYKTLP